MVSCRICGTKFYAKPSHLLLGWGRFCSRKCQAKSQLKGQFVSCFVCSKRVWKMPKDFKNSKSGNFFCSKNCQTIWRNKLYSGEKHSFWAGGKTVYRDILIRNNIKKACKRCGIDDERILMVHHLDGYRGNNNVSNLAWLCCNCHFLIHQSKREMKKIMGILV